MKLCLPSITSACLGLFAAQLQSAEFKFKSVTIDSSISIGYGLAVSDVDGDGKKDILLADKQQIVWYQNPSWQKHVIAENLTPQDNVCIAAADINGDGRAEVAVGAGWNPGDTVNSGAVFYLRAGADRTQKWTPVKLHHEPTVHRMRWARGASGQWGLLVVPLHGRGNKNGQGEGVKSLFYAVPKSEGEEWKTSVVEETMHMTHNFELMAGVTETTAHEILLGGKEGIFLLTEKEGKWQQRGMAGINQNPQLGVGEVRAGRKGKDLDFIAAIEPMHGTNLVVYTRPSKGSPDFSSRKLLDDTLVDGHALACGNLTGTASARDQIVVGWRAMNKPGTRVGIKIFQDQGDGNWKPTLLDDNEMACEDLMLADLNEDGKMDVVAAGRATKNVKIYLNETP